LLQYTQKLGYKNFIVSNQPAIGLGKITMDIFQNITEAMIAQLSKQGITIDGQYYCFHHSFATIEKYRKDCDCRKPKPGLLLQAAKEHTIDLKRSWMIGDGINDILAGHAAGCKTILLGNNLESEYLRLLEKELQGVKPDAIVKKLTDVPAIITE
jgi:D,D-heptose 1,7-bisphosphate phosphatase